MHRPTQRPDHAAPPAAAAPHRVGQALAAVAAAAVSLVTAENAAAGRLLDPVTTHTNGMPLASSTPLRSNQVTYRCDPYHHGCCGGRYNCPCLNSLCRPMSCCSGRRRPRPYGWGQPAVGPLPEVEAPVFETLGSIPAPLVAVGAPGQAGRGAIGSGSGSPPTAAEGLLDLFSQ